MKEWTVFSFCVVLMQYVGHWRSIFAMNVRLFEYFFLKTGVYRIIRKKVVQTKDKSGGKDLNECISVLCYMSPILFPIISKNMADSQTF